MCLKIPSESRQLSSTASTSGIGLLPTESRAKFCKFKKQRFADLNLVGPLEEDIGEEIVGLEWRRQHLDTYDLAQRARDRRSAIHSKLVPAVRYLSTFREFMLPEPEPDPENPTPEELRAAEKRAEKKIRSELGATLELLEIGEVGTLEYLEKRLAILERLDGMIMRAYKKLLFLRGIKSLPSCRAAPSSQRLLEAAE
jgi:hypothetical protein